MDTFANLFGIGTPELIVILIILLLLFGAKKLPELSRSVGSSVKELKKGLSEGAKDEQKTTKKQDNDQA